MGMSIVHPIFEFVIRVITVNINMESTLDKGNYVVNTKVYYTKVQD